MITQVVPAFIPIHECSLCYLLQRLAYSNAGDVIKDVPSINFTQVVSAFIPTHKIILALFFTEASKIVMQYVATINIFQVVSAFIPIHKMFLILLYYRG